MLESEPPVEVRAGESGMWRCRLLYVGAGTAGSVSYCIAGYGENDKITLSWDIRYVGLSKFEHEVEFNEFAI